jgi:hypothetical protein
MKLQTSVIRKLMDHNNGWREDAPEMDIWYFTKRSKYRGYRAVVNWKSNTITFTRLRRIA